jgi:hypothetical protein
MSWAVHGTRMDEMRNTYQIFIGKPEDLGADGKIILEWI